MNHQNGELTIKQGGFSHQHREIYGDSTYQHVLVAITKGNTTIEPVEPSIKIHQTWGFDHRLDLPSWSDSLHRIPRARIHHIGNLLKNK